MHRIVPDMPAFTPKVLKSTFWHLFSTHRRGPDTTADIIHVTIQYRSWINILLVLLVLYFSYISWTHLFFIYYLFTFIIFFIKYIYCHC